MTVVCGMCGILILIVAPAIALDSHRMGVLISASAVSRRRKGDWKGEVSS